MLQRAWRGIGSAVGRILNIEIGGERKEDPLATLYHRPMPPRLSWNWLALILGPFWYYAHGMWVLASVLLGIAFLSGGLLAPAVWIYCGLKANEDLLDFRLARRSVY